MRLTSFTDFGLRALILLAAPRQEYLTAAAIADELQVSRHHMAKVLRQLTAGGFIESQRGPHGGVRLARRADEIRVGEVVRWLEGSDSMVACVSSEGTACVLLQNCRLPAMLQLAACRFLDELDRFTLAECLSPREV